jgi:hypothetical protein
LVRVDPRRRFELWVMIRSHDHLPPLVVDDAVVVTAKQRQVVQVGVAAVGPVGDVMPYREPL